MFWYLVCFLGGAESNGKGFGMIEGQDHVFFHQGQSSETHYIQDKTYLYPCLRDYYNDFNVLGIYYRFSRGAESSGKCLSMVKGQGHVFFSRSEF